MFNIIRSFWRKYVLRYDRALLDVGPPPQDYVKRRLYDMEMDALVDKAARDAIVQKRRELRWEAWKRVLSWQHATGRRY